jgi:hypothetical protein
MTRPKEVVHLVLSLNLVLGILNIGSARAELLVRDVTGIDSITPGARFPDDYVFKLPARSEIRLIRLPDQTPFVIRGRYEGTLSKFMKVCQGLYGSIASYCHEDSAGEPKALGGTR